MGTETRSKKRQFRLAKGAGWASGIAFALVEMQFGMDYVLSHLAGNFATVVAWLPMIGTFLRNLLG